MRRTWFPIAILVVSTAFVAVELGQWWAIDVMYYLGLALAAAYGVRWLWHRGRPLLRGWWRAGE